MTKAYKALEKSVHYSMAYSGFFQCCYLLCFILQPEAKKNLRLNTTWREKENLKNYLKCRKLFFAWPVKLGKT